MALASYLPGLTLVSQSGQFLRHVWAGLIGGGNGCCLLCIWAVLSTALDKTFSTPKEELSKAPGRVGSIFLGPHSPPGFLTDENAKD